VHKANIMKMGDGLFLKCVQEVAANYPDIAQDDRIVDAACMHLVMRPEQFDVLLLPNLYGDIISDLCAGLVGGLGVVPAANLGSDVGVFEAVHGSAPDIAGLDVANPMALLLSALLMLRHIGEAPMAERIMNALGTVLADDRVRTRDLGGDASTTTFADCDLSQACGLKPSFTSTTGSPLVCLQAVVVTDGIVGVLDGRRDHPGRPVPRRDRALPAGQPSWRRRPRADPRVPGRTQNHAALFDLSRSQTSAVSNPPQDRTHRRKR
jgi:hypothetical protein